LTARLMIVLFCAAAAAPAQECPNALCRIVTSGSLSNLRWPDFQDRRSDVAQFYQTSDYQLAWVRENQLTPQALALIGILKDAALKGLNPEDYDASRWDARIAALRASGAGAEQFDVALTISVMRYIWALHVGRANPLTLHPSFDVQYRMNLASFVRDRLASAADPNQVLEEIEPPFEGYRLAEKALDKYLKLAAEDSGEPLPTPAKALKPGAVYEGVADLAQRLRLVGDLLADAAIRVDSDRYQEPLIAAVKHFQSRHGLDMDGVIGAKTLKELNTPLTDRVRQLQLSLERWRWVPHQFPRPPIVINIPEFILRAFDDHHIALEMKVVVGKAYGHQTPVFASDMTTVIFRPEWNVPLSIQRKELVPQLRRDPSSLVKNNYEIVTSRGQLVTATEVTPQILKQLRSGSLLIRQRPGPKNALGLVKFLFPNENDVYLHDTPAQQLFSRSRRDFSHGCIRVERAGELAAWVLRDHPEWPPDRISEAMHGDKTISVSLRHPIPVLIVYGTAVALENGETHFFEDIYGLDAELSQRLASGYPYAAP
jgi:murein L,D-transpeptidase YcbB/YkuD